MARLTHTFDTTSRLTTFLFIAVVASGGRLASVQGQEASVNPGINDAFRDPNVEQFVERFEGESREVYTHREKIAKAVGVKEGMTVADVGAGTGLFTRLL
ncbi:MAG: hypothetical protein KDA61_05215, partial [Planctomycetales bacterium]|nr:hypothetical protein [Planctomycetales bacterium]